MKLCPKCQQLKPLDKFYLRSNGRPRSWCKSCTNADNAGQARKDPDRINRTKRRSLLKRKYGLTEEDVRRMVREQRGKCPICLDAITAGNLNIDHDHRTGRVRGILCGRCNPALGLLRDDPAVIRAAIRYLNRRRAVTEGIF